MSKYYSFGNLGKDMPTCLWVNPIGLTKKAIEELEEKMFFTTQRLSDRLAVELRVEISLEEQVSLSVDELIEIANTLAQENINLISGVYDYSSKAKPSTLLYRAAIIARIKEMKEYMNDPLRHDP